MREVQNDLPKLLTEFISVTFFPCAKNRKQSQNVHVHKSLLTNLHSSKNVWFFLFIPPEIVVFNWKSSSFYEAPEQVAVVNKRFESRNSVEISIRHECFWFIWWFSMVTSNKISFEFIDGKVSIMLRESPQQVPLYNWDSTECYLKLFLLKSHILL